MTNRQKSKTALVLSGGGSRGAYEAGVTAVFPINRRARSFQEIRHLSRSFLAQTAGDILRLIARAEQLRSEPSK